MISKYLVTVSFRRIITQVRRVTVDNEQQAENEAMYGSYIVENETEEYEDFSTGVEEVEKI